MPRIPEYSRQVSAITPGGAPRKSGAVPVAEALGGFGETISAISDDVYRRKVQRDMSELDAAVANATANLTIELKRQAQEADPNDDKFAERFIGETFQETANGLSEIAKTREGRMFLQRNVANMRQQFSVNASNYQTELAATAAKDNYISALNSRSSAVQQNPADFDLMIQQNKDALDLMTGIDAKAKIELRRAGDGDIAMAAAQGWIDLNPLMARQVIESGKYDQYISGEQKAQLLSQADAQMRLQDAELKRLKQAEEDARKEDSLNRFDELLPDIVRGRVSLLSVASDPRMEKAEKDTAKAWISFATSPERNRIKTDAGTFMALWNKIHLPSDDPERLSDVTKLDGYLGKGLTLQDVQSLRAEIVGQRTPQGRIDAEIKSQWQKAAQTALSGTNPLLGFRDPKGDQQVVAYMSWALPQIEEGRAAGKSLQEMLAPDGPIFKALDRYKRSINDQMKDIIVDSPTGGSLDQILEPQPVKEYESLDELQAAFAAGDIGAQQAAEIAREKGWAR